MKENYIISSTMWKTASDIFHGEASIIELEYNNGHFKIDIINALHDWNITQFKKYIDIVLMSVNPSIAAETLNNYIVKLVVNLVSDKKKLIGNCYASDRKAIDTFLNRLIKFNAYLVDTFKVDPVKIGDAEPPKFKRCDVLAYIYDRRQNKATVVPYKGYVFTYKRILLQVYKKNKKEQLYTLTLPCTGMSLGVYSGSYSSAPDYIEENHIIDLLTKPENVEKIRTAHEAFLKAFNESENVMLTPYLALPETYKENQEPEKKPEEPKKELKKELKKGSKEIKKESKEVKKNLEVSEKVKTESQNQTIKEKYQESKYHHNESKTDCKHARRFYMALYIDIGANTHKSILNVSQGTTRSHTGMCEIHHFPITGGPKRKAAPGSFDRFPLILASGPGK